jgi:GntR family transcriptional regulator of arabinose operon
LIDHTSKIPLYRQIIDDLKKQISTGQLKPGDRIASNAELSRIYGVSLITVKNALADLNKDGYLYGRAGKGTFVADPGQFITPPTAGTLGFVLTDFNNPFFTGVLHHIESRVTDFGYRLLVSYASNCLEKEEDQITHFRELGVKGLIIASTEQQNRVPGTISDLHQSGFPYVMISYIEDPQIHYVGSDHERGAFIATAFLIKSGCTKPGFINAERGNSLGKLRRKGYLNALKDHRYPAHPEFEFHFAAARQDFQSGYQIGQQFTAMPDRPDGIFAFNDHSALGFERAVTEAGLNIPADVALVGFDDVEFDVPPPVALTTVRQPADEIAQQALLMLNDQIDQRTFCPRVILQPQIIIRSSCILNGPVIRSNTEIEEIST